MVSVQTIWEKGAKFVGPTYPNLLWTILDFDTETETVLGLCENGATQIFYFHEIEAK